MEEGASRCEHCAKSRALRRYCASCSRRASSLYKREARREAKAAGERYWLDWWLKTYGEDAIVKRRMYQRRYMRKYRAQGATVIGRSRSRDVQS